MAIFDKIIPIITEYNYLGYLIGFVAAFTETIIGIGMLIPGSTIVIFLAAFAAKDDLNIVLLIPFVVLGGALGDYFAYYLGKKVGYKLQGKNYFFWNEKIFEVGSSFFEKYGGKSVFIARFIPSLRENIPFVSGIFQMKSVVFLAWNIPAVLIWGTGWCLIGYYLSKYLNLTKNIMILLGGVVFLVSGIYIRIKYKNKKNKKKLK